MATKTIKQMTELLKKKFPHIWTKPGVEFSLEYKNSIWTGEGSYMDDRKLINAFDNYPESYMDKYYDCGVHVELAKFLEQHGYFAEAYDGGTFFILES